MATLPTSNDCNAVVGDKGACSISIRLDQFASFPNVTPEQTQGLAEWTRTFWLATQQRKHPSLILTILENNNCLQIGSSTGSEIDRVFWEKLVSQALKKIIVDDLGDMDAMELADSIPDTDKDGRGKQDLERMQKELSVKVVFLESNKHVLLVGQKQKLAKKCFTLRNVLSHYHWRLSGKDVRR